MNKKKKERKPIARKITYLKFGFVITLLYICGGVSHDSRMKLSFARNED